MFVYGCVRIVVTKIMTHLTYTTSHYQL